MMSDKEYWEMSKKERKAQDLIDSKETAPKERFYIFDYCKSYGWRQMGVTNGYTTLKEVKNSDTYKFNKEQGTIQMIMKAVVIRE